MNLSEKIDEIRHKPEHIRIRYVWGMVVISMFFIVIIWVFSLKENLQQFKSSDNQKSPASSSLNILNNSQNDDSSVNGMSKDNLSDQSIENGQENTNSISLPKN